MYVSREIRAVSVLPSAMRWNRICSLSPGKCYRFHGAARMLAKKIFKCYCLIRVRMYILYRCVSLSNRRKWEVFSHS